MKSKQKLYLLEFKTDAASIPYVHQQEWIRANSTQEAEVVVNILLQTKPWEILEYKLWLMGTLVLAKLEEKK